METQNHNNENLNRSSIEPNRPAIIKTAAEMVAATVVFSNKCKEMNIEELDIALLKSDGDNQCHAAIVTNRRRYSLENTAKTKWLPQS